MIHRPPLIRCRKGAGAGGFRSYFTVWRAVPTEYSGTLMLTMFTLRKTEAGGHIILLCSYSMNQSAKANSNLMMAVNKKKSWEIVKVSTSKSARWYVWEQWKAELRKVFGVAKISKIHCLGTMIHLIVEKFQLKSKNLNILGMLHEMSRDAQSQ